MKPVEKHDRKVVSVTRHGHQKKVIKKDSVSTSKRTTHSIKYSDGTYGGYDEEVYNISETIDNRDNPVYRSKGQKGISGMASGLIGIFGGGFSILFAIYLYVLFARAIRWVLWSLVAIVIMKAVA